jgi:hydrogenase large subunit
MATKLYEVDPISRIEGHLGVKVEVADPASAVALATGFDRFTALRDNLDWKIWQTNGAGALNYATTRSDPTVAGNWTGLAPTACTFGYAAGWSALALGDSPSVIKDGDTFRLYCGGSNITGPSGTYTNQIVYAESVDGVAWTNAQLALDKDAAKAFMAVKVDTPCVIKVGTSDYRMWFQGTPTGGATRAIGYATSSTGITFTEAASGAPVVPLGGTGAFDAIQTSQPGVVYDGHLFKMYYRAVNAGGVESLAAAQSVNGTTWTKNGQVSTGVTINYNEPCVLEWGESRYVAFVDAATHILYSQDCWAGTIREANAHGNLFRGFENFLIGRRANDAITFTQRICGVCPVPHGTAATFAADNVLDVSEGYATFMNYTVGTKTYGVPEAALHVRNMVLAAEFLMSSITHFYHLAAQSYVQGPPIPPWTPYFDADQYHAALRLPAIDTILPTQNSGTKNPATPLLTGDGETAWNAGYSNNLWSAVITQYVKALRMRRLALEAGALFAGRMPMMSNAVAGGTTNTFRSKQDFDDKLTAFHNLIEEVGTFVVREYIPLTLALGALYSPFDNVHNGGQGYGAGLGNFLAWGGFPQANNNMAIKGGVVVDAAGTPQRTRLLEFRGVRDVGATAVEGDLAWAKAEVQTNLREFITCSRYANTNGYSSGVDSAYPGAVTMTEPERDTEAKYSWLKAPRWAGYAMEVGPLARMVVNGWYPVDGTNIVTGVYETVYGGGTAESPANGLDLRVLDRDLVSGLVGTSVDVTSAVTDYIMHAKGGLSTMDRLRARAIESLRIVGFLIGLPAKDGGTGAITFPNQGWVDELKTLGTSTVPSFYRDVATPVGTKSGYGLVEAPRGALGHFATATNGKLSSYQCVVPTTWNASPKDGTGTPVDPAATSGTRRGAMEEAMMHVTFDATKGQSGPGAITGVVSGVEVLRVAQSFDPCIACAVH